MDLNQFQAILFGGGFSWVIAERIEVESAGPRSDSEHELLHQGGDNLVAICPSWTKGQECHGLHSPGLILATNSQDWLPALPVLSLAFSHSRHKPHSKTPCGCVPRSKPSAHLPTLPSDSHLCRVVFMMGPSGKAAQASHWSPTCSTSTARSPDSPQPWSSDPEATMNKATERRNARERLRLRIPGPATPLAPFLEGSQLPDLTTSPSTLFWYPCLCTHTLWSSILLPPLPGF